MENVYNYRYLGVVKVFNVRATFEHLTGRTLSLKGKNQNLL